MMSNISYKKRLYYLLAGMLILVVVSYQLAIKKTIRLRGECVQLEQKIEAASDAPGNIKGIQNEITGLDKLISSGDTSNSDFRQLLLERTGEFCTANDISLKEFPTSSQTVKDDYIVETNTIVLEGAFSPLLEYCKALEQEYKIGKVVSVEFSSKLDLTSKKNKLSLKVFIQNIKKEKNEK